MSRRCVHCDEPVGVYEPLVWLTPAGPVHGSLLQLREAPEFDDDAATLMHAACHAGRHDGL